MGDISIIQNAMSEMVVSTWCTSKRFLSMTMISERSTVLQVVHFSPEGSEVSFFNGREAAESKGKRMILKDKCTMGRRRLSWQE